MFRNLGRKGHEEELELSNEIFKGDDERAGGEMGESLDCRCALHTT